MLLCSGLRKGLKTPSDPQAAGEMFTLEKTDMVPL